MTDRVKMFLDYKRELCTIDGYDKLVDPEKEYIEDCNFFQNDCDADWIAVKKGKKEVGFLVVLHGRFVTSPLDYFIEDTYIKPEYRCQGLMKKTVENYLKKHQGLYGLEIMDKNQLAHKFWRKIVGERWFGVPIQTHEDAHEYRFDARSKVDD